MFRKEYCFRAHTKLAVEEGKSIATEGGQVKMTQSENLHGTEISFPFKK